MIPIESDLTVNKYLSKPDKEEVGRKVIEHLKVSHRVPWSSIDYEFCKKMNCIEFENVGEDIINQVIASVFDESLNKTDASVTFSYRWNDHIYTFRTIGLSDNTYINFSDFDNLDEGTLNSNNGIENRVTTIYSWMNTTERTHRFISTNSNLRFNASFKLNVNIRSANFDAELIESALVDFLTPNLPFTEMRVFDKRVWKYEPPRIKKRYYQCDEHKTPLRYPWEICPECEKCKKEMKEQRFKSASTMIGREKLIEVPVNDPIPWKIENKNILDVKMRWKSLDVRPYSRVPWEMGMEDEDDNDFITDRFFNDITIQSNTPEISTNLIWTV